MATMIRFEKELTREALESLRREIDQLLALPSLDGTLDPAERKVRALWPRIGENSRRLLIEVEQLGDWTMEGLASKMAASVEQVRAWHRNISRSLKQIDQRYGADPPIFGEHRWDGQRNYYRMWMNVRAAIRKVSEEDPQ